LQYTFNLFLKTNIKLLFFQAVPFLTHFLITKRKKGFTELVKPFQLY